MSDQAIQSALAWKNDFNQRSDAELYVVTQFVFESAPIIEWDRKMREQGVSLPVNIGIPGLATLKTLLMHAKACGIGPSMKFLTKQARNVAKLMNVNAPDKLVRELAEHVASTPESLISGVHVYPLGGLRRSAAWSYAVADGLITPDSKGGFGVDTEIG